MELPTVLYMHWQPWKIIIKISTCTHGRQYFRSNSIARRQPSPLYPLPLQHTLEVSLIIYNYRLFVDLTPDFRALS